MGNTQEIEPKTNPKTTSKYQRCFQSLKVMESIRKWKNFQKLHKKHEDNLKILEEEGRHIHFDENDIKKIIKILRENGKVNDLTEEYIKEIWKYRDMKKYYLGKPCPSELKVKLIFYKDYFTVGKVIRLQNGDDSDNQGEHVDIRNERGNPESFNLSDVLSVELLEHE